MIDEATMDVAAAQPAVSEAPEISNEPVQDAVDAKGPVSTRDALTKAFETVDKADKPDTLDGGKERNPDGTFKAKETVAEVNQGELKKDEPKAEEKPAETVSKFEPPSRFSPDAKAAWETAPEPVKAEINRAVTELEAGIEQHRQAFEPYREFDQNLKANGQDFQTVISHYTGIEQKLS
jgi:hypothetical protein